MLLMVSWISKMMKYLVSALSLTYLFLSTSLGMGENKLIDDFSNESQNRWQFFTDQVMGGISEGNASLVSDKSGQYVRLEGSVSTANNGGFIQIRTDINEGTNEAKGIIIKAKGNGEDYYIHLRTSGTVLPWQYYQISFPTSKNWSEIKLPFANFERSSSWISKKITGDKIRTLGIVAYGKNHNAKLDVAYLSFY
tara:strand:+ start:575 stop:1159 length:585 start_codon:yes stop_codon:yes gene_type:complete